MRGLAFIAAGLLGFIALVLWLITLPLALSLTPWAILPGLLAAGATFLGWRLFRWRGSLPSRSIWDLDLGQEMRAAEARLPAGTKIRRSRAGRPALATIAAWVVYITGVVVAAGILLAEVPDPINAAYLILGATGTVAGALLAVSQDGRSRRATFGTVVSMPALLGLLILASAWDAATTRGLFGQMLLATLIAVLASGLPIAFGFVLIRFLVAFYESTRPQVLNPVTPEFALSPELRRATDRGRATAAERIYNIDKDEMTLYAEDRAQLQQAGYRVAATEQYNDHWSEENWTMLKVLFVRADAAPAEAESDAIHPDPAARGNDVEDLERLAPWRRPSDR